MATLVLTAVGTLAGGPIGGAIGAALGSQLDQRLLAPRGRAGPRLGDLSVQTSSYGSAIPRLFGTMRVAGTVIWASDIREDVHRSGGGKGGARTTSYAYSASFAVALSARPIRAVHRIWADGKLLRGAGGDWTGETGFRLHLGGEEQAPDPLIASAEGIGRTPACRGLAYAVFDGLQLADFGNRIPSLTFEVEADAAPVTVGAIAAALSDGAVAGQGGLALAGFAAAGESVRGVLDTLARACPLSLRDDGTRLWLDPGPPVSLDSQALGASNRMGQPRRAVTRAAAATLPDEIALSYYEPERDYQPGLQRARRDGIGVRGERIELPAALAASAARGLAEEVLARRWSARERRTTSLSWRAAEIGAGTAVLLDGIVWRVAARRFETMMVALDLVREGAVAGAAPADAGRAVADTVEPAGATLIRLVDLPTLDDRAAVAPAVFLAAAGTRPGWRRAELALSYDGGASWSAAGRTAAPAILGHAVAALPPGPRDLFDRAATLEIELAHVGMALVPADERALIAGANLVLLGDELLQFGRADQIGPRRWRLRTLLRGRRGSDWAIAGHVAGEPFLLLDAATLLPLDLSAARVGALLDASASGPGDGGVPARATLPIAGRALLPPAPIRLGASRESDGAIAFRWIRRSRTGWTWLDGADAPLGEESERYRLMLDGPGGRLRVVEPVAPAFRYDLAAQAADGWRAGTSLIATLAQLGGSGASLPPLVRRWTF